MMPVRSDQRLELAEFIKSRRLRLDRPANAAPSSRRRLMGLRREELAQLAGVGLTWYTWLEQGRDIRVSDGFLDNLSRALGLDQAERRHLFFLAQNRPPSTTAAPTTKISESLRRLIDSHADPIYVKNLRWDVVAWNHAAAIMFGDYARIPIEHRNVLWLVFRSRAYRALMVDWTKDARYVVGRFRSDFAELGQDERAASIVTELKRTSREFRCWWSSHDVIGRSGDAKRLTHRLVGEMQFEHTRLRVDDVTRDPLCVVVFTPLPGESSARAARLFAHPRG
jgi:transcriptional regulator with XRE-family HTH domain